MAVKFDPKQTVPFVPGGFVPRPIAVSVIVCRIETLGEPVTGGWCQSCLLPSVITVRYRLWGGTRVLAERSVSRCEQCGIDQTARQP